MKDFALTNVDDSSRFGYGRMDITYNPSGDVALVEGPAFLNQGVQKGVLVTQNGSNLNDNYGSIIRSVVGTKVEDTIFRSFLINAISDALQRFQADQSVSQVDFTYADEEVMEQMGNITIAKNSDNKTEYDITVYIASKSGNISTINFVLPA